jgi:TldD protein
MQSLDLCRVAIDEARAAARRAGTELDYADARAGTDRRQYIAVRDQSTDAITSDESSGIGVRVLYRGAWGFGARPSLTAESAAAAARDAVAVARAAHRALRQPVRLAEEPPQRGRYETRVTVDPFAVPLERKLADLLAATAALSAPPDPRILSATAQMLCRRTAMALASSEGTAVEQVLTHVGCGMTITCAEGELMQQRSYPTQSDGGVAAGGYELVGELDPVGHAPRVRDEALALLQAPPCPAGRRTVLLDTSQLALQIHESCGHPTESDRALGEELSLAGGSFLEPGLRGQLQYGSSLVNLSADSLTPGGLGTFGWDDEGVPARRTPLVEQGRFVGYLTSRETAARLGLQHSGGCLRAESWNRPALVRMVNVSLEPAASGPTLEELIADTSDGLLLSENRSWSIDDIRKNFQFGCEMGWEIRGGKRVRMLRSPVYTGSTPVFWGGCDAICGPSEFRMWGFVSCGKGDPMQLMPVGHGCAPARFVDVEVGAG